MGTEKLSISLDAELATAIRAAAAAADTSISTWLAEAAENRVRHTLLREAVDAFAAEHGSLDAEERARLVAAARRGSIVTGTAGAA